MGILLNTIQVSLFLRDGVMNPSKYIEIISSSFSKKINKVNYDLSALPLPDDVPIINYASSDNEISYEFSRKRLNFYFNFNLNNDDSKIEEYFKVIREFIKKTLKPTTEISRIGIAAVYYINKKDIRGKYWQEKYNFPLYEKESTEQTYSINNRFINEGLWYNNIITLFNSDTNGTKYPTISVDVNNVEVDNLNEKQIDFILNKCDKYLRKYINSIIE